MKKSLIVLLAGFSTMLLLSGCLDLQIGGGAKNATPRPTVGQQLLDLQKAHAIGAITDSEYQAQKAKILEGK